MSIYPNLSLEKELWRKGFKYLAGVDEAGMGAWAGPLAVASVILPKDFNIPGIKDSKQLTPKRREEFFDQIVNVAIDYSIVLISEQGIDRDGIRGARDEGVRIAIKKLSATPNHILIDGFAARGITLPQTTYIKGDTKIKSIACASILAKVQRDRALKDLHLHHPNYGFNLHKGYGTKAHREALNTYGPSPIHRLSFSPIKEMC